MKIASAGSGFSRDRPPQGARRAFHRGAGGRSGGPQVAGNPTCFRWSRASGRPPPEGPPRTGLAGVESRPSPACRASHGLPALQRDTELDAAAEGHSQQMARRGRSRTCSLQDGSPGDRSARAATLPERGRKHRSFQRRRQRARGHRQLAPHDLANLLDPHHRRLGLGGRDRAHRRRRRSGVPHRSARRPGGGKLGSCRRRRRFLAGERQKRGLPPLRRDPASTASRQTKIRSVADADQMKLDRALPERALEQVPELSSAVAELFVGSGPDDVENVQKPRRAEMDPARRRRDVCDVQAVRPGAALGRCSCTGAKPTSAAWRRPRSNSPARRASCCSSGQRTQVKLFQPRLTASFRHSS